MEVPKYYLSRVTRKYTTKIGEGAFGEVFLGEDPELETADGRPLRLAVKRVRPAAANARSAEEAASSAR